MRPGHSGVEHEQATRVETYRYVRPALGSEGRADTAQERTADDLYDMLVTTPAERHVRHDAGERVRRAAQRPRALHARVASLFAELHGAWPDQKRHILSWPEAPVSTC